MTTNKKDIKYKIPKNFYKSFQKELSQDAKLIKELLTTDKLNKTENFNTSEGNVKENNTFPNDNVKKSHNEQDLERVADTSKTIDHIADVSKKVSLTEQWKKGELEVGEEYWVILTDEWYLRSPVVPVRAFYSCECEFEGYLDNDIKEVLAPVPSFEQWNAMLESNDSLIQTINALKNRLFSVAEENKGLKKVERKKGALVNENYKLKELLTDICCELVDDEEDMTNGLLQYFNTDVIDRIREALK